MKYNKLLDAMTKKEDDLGCGAYLIAIVLAAAIVLAFSFLNAWIAMLLWNWTMPMIWASAPVMTFWPMWALVELCSILFKNQNFNSNTNSNE